MDLIVEVPDVTFSSNLCAQNMESSVSSDNDLDVELKLRVYIYTFNPLVTGKMP